jgi:hypothetical protein
MKWILFSILVLYNPLFASQVIRTTPPQSEFDISHSYFIGLLQLAIDKTENDYEPTQIKFSSVLQQGRAFVELENNRNIDVYWSGTSIKREHRTSAIRVPLVKGMLGIRQFIIPKSKEIEFSFVNTLDDLKKFVACQGAHWPDSDILEQAGLKVIKNPIYEGIFKQLSAGRCDYFPRGVHEGKSEVLARQSEYPNLKWYSELILYYPFPMYFFVSKDNYSLKLRIEKGLKMAVDDGSFEQFMRSHSVTAGLFPLSQWLEVRTIEIDNIQLPKNTERQDSRYWLQITK